MLLKELSDVFLTLHESGLQRLFLMLSSDGTIRRSGNGSAGCLDTSMHIGKDDGTAFAMAKSLATDIQQWIGSYVAPEQCGDLCHLVIGLKASDGSEEISEWEYGSQSEGPPPEIIRFVQVLVATTDRWHESQIVLRPET